MSQLTRLKDGDMGVKHLHHKLKVEGSYSANISTKLDFLVDGIEEYQFHLESCDPSLLVSLTKEEVLNHLYHILLNYLDADDSVNLCKVFVLYSVKILASLLSFPQKQKEKKPKN